MELSELFEAYYECRRNKRGTANALIFELDYESNLMKLYEEVKNRTYEVDKSIVFVVNKPVKREIFAGDFRDRIIHHYIIRKLNSVFEKLFIHDSYSCREWKGTLFGIKRIDTFIRSATDNYMKDAYILKLDIQGFFMNIDRTILLSQIRRVIDTKYIGDSLSPPCQGGVGGGMRGNLPSPLLGNEGNQMNARDELFWLCEKIIGNDPTKNCTIKGRRDDWLGLPRSKSLFFSPEGVGLPIGNLTSQIFANLYLHELDIFIKKELRVKYYGRYVDDFVLIHEDSEYLKKSIETIKRFLLERLRLDLHPKKIHFQHYTKGVAFLGAYIKPHRIYVGRRMKGNFFETIKEINRMILEDAKVLQDRETRKLILSKINSYLGLMRHYDSFTLRKKFLFSLHASFWNYFYISEQYRLIVQKTRESFIF